MCAEYCEGETYFGTQWSSECWCGDEKTNLHKHDEIPTCDYPCGGDAEETCGGSRALSVYKYGGAPDWVPEGTKYLGCYVDTYRERVFTLNMTTDNAMTLQVQEGQCTK